MRLIDADALMQRVQQEEIQAQVHGREFSTSFHNDGGTVSTEWWFVEDLIENAPTIEPEPSQVARDIATIIQNEKDMRVIARSERKTCDTCRYNHLEWHEEPCDSCTGGNNHWEPERKKGEWYKPTGMMPPEYAGVYRCSECNEFAMRDWKHHKQVLTKFCPNCGADMRPEGGRDDRT